MRWISLAALASCFSFAVAFAQGLQTVKCSNSETLIPITFHFQVDPIAQSTWVLESLKPTLVLNQRSFRPNSQLTTDGALALTFCAPTTLMKNRFTFTVGPRALVLAARPTAKGTDGTARMTEIDILNQPKPNWVILKSIERLTSPSGGLPSFDVELFNFGSTHPGGRVRYHAANHDWSCDVGRPGVHVSVTVGLSGQRLKVSSADPEYPEEEVERSAEVRTGYCGGNFDVTIDFGPTGQLPPGPTRIRYALKSTTLPAALSNRTPGPRLGIFTFPALPDLSAVGRYFPSTGYSVEVSGGGIW